MDAPTLRREVIARENRLGVERYPCGCLVGCEMCAEAQRLAKLTAIEDTEESFIAYYRHWADQLDAMGR